MKQITFVSKQVIGEYWISFVNDKNIEIGIIVKKLSDGSYLIPSGTKKKVFILEEIENIQASTSGLVQLPFIIGITDFHSTDSMKPETFRLFLAAFKKAFCLPEPASA